MQQEHTYKVVASSRESLYYRHFVLKGRACRLSALSFFPGEIVNETERRCPHDEEVEDHWDEDAKDRAKVMYDMVSLVGEHDDDGV